MRLVIRDDALAEVRAAALRYADQSPALALQFIDAVKDALQRVRASPMAWRIIDEDVRRCLTRGFPYGVFYTVERDFISILAIAHCSREPGYWRARRTP
jgi:plasmid stabilization system protein ParE